MLYLSDGGRLAQISTGEGKTTIVSMLAVLAILSGKENVDIVTSSSVNAEDGKRSQEAFYEIFGLEADYNTNRDSLDLQRVYRKQIVYGTVNAFEGDIIRQNTGINNDRGDRKIQFLIIDEADNMLRKRLANPLIIINYSSLRFHGRSSESFCEL
jgi:preprotein translocase subunit SecA